jgi:ubiquinone/menaquinone biosynthesis C-methylase UbiE
MGNIPQDYWICGRADRRTGFLPIYGLQKSITKKLNRMHEKIINGDIERLRMLERIARLVVKRMVTLSLEVTDFKSVLDVGVGSGLSAEAFAQHGIEVASVDINPEMIVTVKRFVPKGDFREATEVALPYSDASFDLVFFVLVLHESDEPFKILQEAR